MYVWLKKWHESGHFALMETLKNIEAGAKSFMCWRYKELTNFKIQFFLNYADGDCNSFCSTETTP